jgi:hypothetical protein
VQVAASQVPARAPSGLLQSSPEQQSVAVVQEPPVGMQAAAQRSVPLLSAMHGLPQQSADDAQTVPGAGGVLQSPTLFMRHRGMPTESRWQHCSGWLLQVPDFMPGGSQQLSALLQEVVPPVLQICPGSWHAFAWLEQRPYAAEELDFEQRSPQQSESDWQISPIGWQPEGFWQTLLPFSPPVGPQAREQQDAWHCTLPAGHKVPATLHWPAPVPPALPQVPFWLLPVFTQLPLQHWLAWEQMSPTCAQYETSDEQTPLLQSPEQQSVLVEQPLPEVRQPPPGLMPAQKPFVQTPLQHCVGELQAPATGLSWTQAVAAHFWSEPQKLEQQSDGWVHDAPTATHALPPGVLHTLAVGTPQVPPFAQVAPPPHWM